jgi:hypothetical protein
MHVKPLTGRDMYAGDATRAMHGQGRRRGRMRR